MSDKIKFSKLCEKQNGSYIAYQMLLETQEWSDKRNQIIKRDDGKCTKCGKWATEKFHADDETFMHVWYDH